MADVGGRVLALGVGRGGTRLVDLITRYHEGSFEQLSGLMRSVGVECRSVTDYFRPFAINTHEKDLEILHVPKESRLLLGPGTGVGGDPQRCYELARKHAEELESFLGKQAKGLPPHFCFLFNAAGGATGAGAAPVVSNAVDRAFVDSGIVGREAFTKVAITILPFSYEIGRYEENAAFGIARLLPSVDSIVIADNDAFYQRIPEKTLSSITTNQLYEAVNSEILTQVKLLTVSGLPIYSKEDLVMDSSDLRSVFVEASEELGSRGVVSVLGHARSYVEEGKPKASLLHMLKKAVIEGTTAACDYRTARAASMIICGPSSPMIKDVYDSVKWLGSEINGGSGGTVRWGNAIIEGYDCFELVVLLAGVTVPRLSGMLEGAVRKRGEAWVRPVAGAAVPASPEPQAEAAPAAGPRAMPAQGGGAAPAAAAQVLDRAPVRAAAGAATAQPKAGAGAVPSTAEGPGAARPPAMTGAGAAEAARAAPPAAEAGAAAPRSRPEAAAPARPRVFVESSKQEFLNARNEAFSSFFSVLREAGEVVEVRDILRGFRPSPGDVLVVGVPLRGFLPAEAALLRTAVRDTGIALVLIAEWGGTPANVDHLNQLISGLGVAFNRDVVCQYGGAGAVTCAMALDGLRDHPIMSGVSGIQVEAACSISISDRSVSPLMWGGERSFADSNFNMFPDSFERRGFVVISAALSHGNGRVVLFGDSDMFSNRYLRLGNLQMLRNAIAWSSTAASGRPASGLNLTPDRAASLSCGMSDDEALLGYIRGCQASGFTRDEIRHRLLSEGYTEDEIRGPLGEA